ncbi:MAG: hypothetical protein AAFO84_16165 [Cyanobacteria bacterium J06598_1]
MSDSSLPQLPPSRSLLARRNEPSRASKLGYLGVGLLANTLIWGLAIAYLSLSPKTYKSEWGIKVLSTGREVDVSLPDGWKSSASATASKKLTTEDPRSDYVYLIQSPDLMKEAASQVGIPIEDFGELEITTNSQSSLIEFVVVGDTPEMAQKKARALHVVLDRRVAQLRKAELVRRERDTRESLETAREQVEVAQAELSNYQATSGLSSDSQIEDLAVGIEQLRREYAQSLAQEKGLGSRVQQLANDINESSAGAADAYRLQSDPVYQSQFEAYGNVAAAYADISAQLGDRHPQVVSKRAELDGLAAAVESRGSFLLGRPVDQAVLTQLAPIGLDPRVEASRGALFQDAVTNRANQVGLQSQTQELANQMAVLEERLRRLSQEKVKVDRLKRDLQTSEALFASSVAKLNLNENDIYAIYPPIQLATEPTLAEEDKYISPSPSTAIVGALASSFLVITGLLLLWVNTARDDDDEFETADFPFRV